MNSFGPFLDVTVEHRGVRIQADFMSGLVNVEPLIGFDLGLEDLVVHPVVEDLRATSGE